MLSLSIFAGGSAIGYYTGRSLSFVSEDFMWLISESTAELHLIGLFFIVAASGMKFGVEFLRGKRDENELLDETLKVVLASLLLIAVAAFIEAFITPVLISSVI